MKIVKRDGRIVEYEPDKIRIAIGKANKEVMEAEQINARDVEKIIAFIESLGKKRMLVEDIQDIIEEKLMERKKYKLAKTYIIYRYKRSVIRQSNSIDASILSILKNNKAGDGNYLDANRQRDLMAGEVSKDLANRLLLPANVASLHASGAIDFLNIEYFTEPVIESVYIDVSRMFENSTVINGIKISEPKGFQAACNVLVELASQIASVQTGNIYINYKDLFKYYDLSWKKTHSLFKTLLAGKMSEEEIKAIANTQTFLEVKTGIQTIMYQLNTITTRDAVAPKLYVLINPDDIQNDAQERLVFEFIKQKADGIAEPCDTLVVPDYPHIVYAVGENDKYSYILDEVQRIAGNYTLMSEKRFAKFKKEIKKFNQGSIAINLAHLATESSKTDNDFLILLEETLSACYEGLSCRNHNLQGTYSGKSPIHWQYGGIARLDADEKIDSLLKKGSSVMTLVVMGFEEATKILSIQDEMKKRICDKIVQTVEEWNKESSFEVIISNDYKLCDTRGLYASTNRDEMNLKESLDFIDRNYFADTYIYYHYEACDDIKAVINTHDSIIFKHIKEESPVDKNE